MSKIPFTHTLAVCVGIIAFSASVVAQPSATGVAKAPPSTPYVSNATNSTALAAEIPCERVRKNPDGSWTFLGTVVMGGPGGMTMVDTTVGGGREGPILEARCGHPAGK